MDAQRELLDQLMGKTRNLPDALKSKVREIHFSDKEVCKYHLAGLCPHNLFNATKSDIGKCNAEICGNSDALRAREQFLQLSQPERDAHGYEYDLMVFLQDLVRTCDQKIQKNKRRAEKEMALSEDSLKKVSELDSQIRDLTEKCVAAAEDGDIDLSQQISSEIDALKEEIEKITNPKDVKTTTVCEVSGNFMSMRDNDDRMRAHFEGKQFLGWKAVRDKLAELKARNLKLPSKTNQSQSKGQRDRVDERPSQPQRPLEKERDQSFRKRDSSTVNESISSAAVESSRDRERGDRAREKSAPSTARSRSRDRPDRSNRPESNGRHERPDRPARSDRVDRPDRSEQRTDSSRSSKLETFDRSDRPERPQQYNEPRRERCPPVNYPPGDREGLTFRGDYRDYPERFDYVPRHFDEPPRDSFNVHDQLTRQSRRSRSRSNERPRMKRAWEGDRRGEESRRGAPGAYAQSSHPKQTIAQPAQPANPVALKPQIEIKAQQQRQTIEELEEGEEVEG